LNLSRLAITFSLLSLFGFGGGSAMLPQMHADVVEKYHWISSAEFARFYALGKLAPGPTTTMAALIGFAVAGAAGAALATVAVFVPAGLLVYGAGAGWRRFSGHPLRDRFATAIKPVVLGLIWAGAFTIARGAITATVTAVMAVAATIVLLRTNWNQSLLVLVAGIIGALLLRSS
jgi:chromate transporter